MEELDPRGRLMGKNKWLQEELAAEQKGREFMEERVTRRNQESRKYVMSVHERAITLGKEELFDELTNYAQREICEPLFKAFNGIFGQREIEKAREDMHEKLKYVALRAREFAMHHSGYKVGTAILALKKVSGPTENPWVVLFDANTKLDEEKHATPEGHKWCGEQNSLDRVVHPEPGDPEIARVVKIVVTGEPRPDDRSKKPQIVLSPCHICRDRMVYDPELVSGDHPLLPDDTEVYMFDPDIQWREKYSKVGTLHEHQGETIDRDGDG